MSNDKPSTPFEWLFGKSGENGSGSIDSCKDAMTLLKGIHDDFEAMMEEMKIEKAKGEDGTNDTGKEPPKSQKILTSSTSSNVMAPSDGLDARLARLRFLLYDERRLSSQQEHRRSTPTVAGRTMQGLTQDNSDTGSLIPKLVSNLQYLPFESRRHVAAIFNYLLVCGLEGTDGQLYFSIMCGFRDYVEKNFELLLTEIVKGHESAVPGVGLHCGTMYRSCVKHIELFRQLVCTTDRVERFIFPFLERFVNVPQYDIASDAMESLRLVLTAGSAPVPYYDEATQQQLAEITAEFLTRDYTAIWEDRFNLNMVAEHASYTTIRESLAILSSVLLTRSNYAVMIKYVNNRQNLIVAMKLLRHTSPHITLDAFHVFKVFVANPNKIPEVVKILCDNKEKLSNYLETLHTEKESSDPQFRDEKALIIATIRAM